MIKSIWLYLERWFPSLIISRANKFSYHLELDTGYSIKTVDSEDGLQFFLIGPCDDPIYVIEHDDHWSNLDDCIFDLSDFERSNCLEHLPS